jgi:hypothetical protein
VGDLKVPCAVTNELYKNTVDVVKRNFMILVVSIKLWLQKRKGELSGLATWLKTGSCAANLLGPSLEINPDWLTSLEWHFLHEFAKFF